MINIIEAFRGLGNVFTIVKIYENSSSDQDISQYLNTIETSQFETLGTMIDCSRCAVMNLDTVFLIIRISALLGLNTLQLYTEDTYEVEGEEFFGYLRGNKPI